MKILLFCKIFEKSGVGSHIKSLCCGLKDAGHEVYIASSTNKHEDFCQKHNIEVLNVEFPKNIFLMYRNIKILKDFLQANKIDIVHCHHRMCGLYMQLINRKYHIPFLWTNHISDIPDNFLYRKLTFYGERVICVSSYLKQACVEQLHIPPEKIAVVFNGICPSEYREEPEFRKEFIEKHHLEGKIVFLLFARMSPDKGHKCLIEAVSKLSTEIRKKIHIVFTDGNVGGEYIYALKAEINRLGLEDLFTFVGFITPSQAFSIADVTVLPSIREGFLISAIESFYMKKLCIRTKTAGYSDMADCCIGIDIGDSDALSYEMGMIAGGEKYDNIINRAYDFVINECTQEKMTEKILSIYNEIKRQYK